MKFFIYRGEGSTGQLQKVAEVTDTTTYTATNLKAKTTYRFAVSAHNGLRESEKSNIVTVSTSGISAVSVTLTINSTSLEVGGIAKATVTVNPANQTDGTVTYTSSNTQVATIDQNGNITAKKTGTTDIKAAIGGVESSLVRITVYEALVNVSGLRSSNVTANSVTLNWS